MLVEKHPSAYIARVPPPLRTPADLGAALREGRRRRGWRQVDLASAMGVSRLWVGEAEAGKGSVRADLVLRAFGALGLEVVVRSADGVTAGDPGPDVNAIVAASRRGDRG